MTRRNISVWTILFWIYCIMMLILLFLRKTTTSDLPYWELVCQQTNLEPFSTILRQFRRLFDWEKPWLIRHSIVNLAGNIALFVPMGIFLPRLFSCLNTWWKVLGTAGLIIIAVELGQVLMLVGRCDIDDLILNLAGTLAGYGIYRLHFPAAPKSKQSS